MSKSSKRIKTTGSVKLFITGSQNIFQRVKKKNPVHFLIFF